MPVGLPIYTARRFLGENNIHIPNAALAKLGALQGRARTVAEKGLIIQLLQDNNLLDKFTIPHWPIINNNSAERQARINRYLAAWRNIDQFADEDNLADEDDSEDQAASDTEIQDFNLKLESHLRDALARDLSKLEKGLALYSENGISGVEFAIDGGRIDILARDQKGNFVVIELKNYRGRNRALGQILYYMAWIDKNKSNAGVKCRGMIVANTIDDELRLAASRVDGIELCKYTLSIQVEKVK